MTSMTLGLGLSAFLLFADDAVERLNQSSKVFEEIMATPDKGIPQDVLANAKCVVIVPAMKKAGFIVGGQYGVGVSECRQGTGWTGPSTIKLSGGSFGLQIGGGETDIVMLIMNDKGVEKIIKGDFSVGGEGEAMAGPVGQAGVGANAGYKNVEILSYSRSKGAFAGVTLKGSSLKADNDANKKLYGKEVKHEDILQGKVPPPPAAGALTSTLTKYSK